MIQGNNPAALTVELNQWGLGGWTVVQLSATQAMVAEAGTGHIVITVIFAHELPG